jgi:hypothetical protein
LPGRRLIPASALLVALLALAPVALGRAAPSRPAACQGTSRHAHHGSHKSRCSHRHSSSVKHATKHHPAKPPAPKPVPRKTAARVPAKCEDGSAPTRAAGGSFTCADGSEPGCSDGSEPTSAAGGTILACPIVAQGGGQEVEDECPAEGECTPSEAPCEASEDGSSPSCTAAEAEA